MTKRKSIKLTSRLGKNIAVRRKAIGLTQDRLAEQVGVDVETISRFERGATAPSLATLEILSNSLGATMSELLEEGALEPASEALIIAAQMAKLKTKDKNFLMELIKLYCERHS